MSSVTSLLASFWRLFSSLRVPLLGISFAELYLGAFVVTLSIKILFPLLGIGADSVRNLVSARDRHTQRQMQKEKLNSWRANHD